MKKFSWSVRKNKWLKEHRNISFEEILEKISSHLLDVRENLKHKNQKIFIVNINNYP